MPVVCTMLSSIPEYISLLTPSYVYTAQLVSVVGEDSPTSLMILCCYEAWWRFWLFFSTEWYVCQIGVVIAKLYSAQIISTSPNRCEASSYCRFLALTASAAAARIVMGCSIKFAPILRHRSCLMVLIYIIMLRIRHITPPTSSYACSTRLLSVMGGECFSIAPPNWLSTFGPHTL